MGRENYFESNIAPDEFVECGGVILEYSDDENPIPLKWICGHDQFGEKVHPQNISITEIYTYLDNEGQWIGTTQEPDDADSWSAHTYL